MAHAPTSSEVAIAGTKPVTAKRSFTRKFWAKITTIIVVIISPWIPCLWGWQMGWIGAGHGSWSMAAHNGIMPGSIVYHKHCPIYSVKDKISFEYRGSADPTQNGPSLKLIVAKNSDGSYRVKGMNYVNSFAPCDVKPEDINGKVVWNQSFMPESFWRWLSLDWTLNTDEIDARWHAIFSLRTIGCMTTSAGWFRNWRAFRFNPLAVVDGPNGRYLVKTREDFSLWQGRTELVPQVVGTDPRWFGSDIGYFSGDGYFQMDGNTLKTIRVRDGASIIHYVRKPDSDELWEGEVAYMPVFDAWSLTGKLEVICPEVVKNHQDVEVVTTKGKVLCLLAGKAEYYSEQDYPGSPGGITVLHIAGLKASEPMQKTQISLRLRP